MAWCCVESTRKALAALSKPAFFDETDSLASTAINCCKRRGASSESGQDLMAPLSISLYLTITFGTLDSAAVASGEKNWSLRPKRARVLLMTGVITFDSKSTAAPSLPNASL